MKRISRCIACGVLAVLIPAIAARRAEAQAPGPGEPNPKTAGRAPVLVELFTSEGCPHCPEADALLERLYTGQPVVGAQIVALEEHVDYWDRPAWVDHFSSPAYTTRQKVYADAMDLESLYTPQMVVDGLVEFVGVNESRARATISALGQAPKAAAQLIFQTSALYGGKKPIVNISAWIDVQAADQAAEVYWAVAEDKLSSRVQGGRNAGETWPHSSVARRIQLLGEIPRGETHFARQVDLGTPESTWQWLNLRLILFVQQKETRRVIAINTVRLAEFMPEVKGGGQPAVERASPDASGAAPKTAPASSKPFEDGVP